MTTAAIETKVIIPPDLDPQWILEELEKEFRKQVGKIESAYLLTMGTWNTPAKFNKTITVGKDFMIGFVGTNDRRYLWIDEGTKPRPIVPRPDNRRGLLFFQEGYNAKTRPGQVGSFAGGRYGPVVARAAAPKYPGIKARNLTTTIKAKLEPRFYKDMTRAFDRGVKKAQAAMAKGAKGP